MIFAALIASAILAAATAPPAPSTGQPQPPPPAPTQQFPDFDAMDTNHDGKVTKAEFMAALNDDQKRIGERIFAARDANKDGVLTRDEMASPQRH